MTKEKQTTVNLTKKAQVIKEEFAPLFGLKNILSAGLILLNKLDQHDLIKIITEANDDVDSIYDIKNYAYILEKTKSFVENEIHEYEVAKANCASCDIEQVINDLKQIRKKLNMPKKLNTQISTKALKELVHRYIRDFFVDPDNLEALSIVSGADSIVYDTEVAKEEHGRMKGDKKPKSG